MAPRKGYIITDQYATYFVTMTTIGWIDLFTRVEIRDILIKSLQYCQQHKGLIVNAYVIMSNHIHIIWRANEASEGLSNIMRDFKKFTSKQIIEFVLNSPRESRKEWIEVVMKYHAKYDSNNKSYKIWQSSNQPKMLIHPKFTIQKINYIHYNPVVAKIVQQPEHYLYSSARNYVGIIPTIMDVEIIDFGVQEGYVMM